MKRRSIVLDTAEEAVSLPEGLPSHVPGRPAGVAGLTQMTVTAFIKVHKLRVKKDDIIGHAKSLVQIHKRRGIPTGRVPDEKYGALNSYDIGVMMAYFRQAGYKLGESDA